MRRQLDPTKDQLRGVPGLYMTEHLDDPLVRLHWFSIQGNWDWYATEFDPDQGLAFGLVHGHELELGFWTLDELASATAMGGRLPLVERDQHWTPIPLSQCYARHGGSRCPTPSPAPSTKRPSATGSR